MKKIEELIDKINLRAKDYFNESEISRFTSKLPINIMVIDFFTQISQGENTIKLEAGYFTEDLFHDITFTKNTQIVESIYRLDSINGIVYQTDIAFNHLQIYANSIYVLYYKVFNETSKEELLNFTSSLKKEVFK